MIVFSNSEVLSMRRLFRWASSILCLLLLAGPVAACAPATPTDPAPVDFLDVAFLYQSQIQPGNAAPSDAGVCEHHMLGASHIDVFHDDELIRSLFMRRDERGRWAGTLERLPTGEPLVAVIRDLACCTVAGVCQPVEGLFANAVPLSRVATVTGPGGAMTRGLGFQISRTGRITS